MFRKIWNFFFGRKTITVVYVGDIKNGYMPTQEDIDKVAKLFADGGMKNVIVTHDAVRTEQHFL